MQTQTDGFSVSVYITGTTAVPTADQAIAGAGTFHVSVLARSEIRSSVSE